MTREISDWACEGSNVSRAHLFLHLLALVGEVWLFQDIQNAYMHWAGNFWLGQ